MGSNETTSVSHKDSLFKDDTRITKSKKDQAKIRGFEFFKLKRGEFVSFADGIEKKVQFKRAKIVRELPPVFNSFSKKDLNQNFRRIMEESERILNLFND